MADFDLTSHPDSYRDSYLISPKTHLKSRSYAIIVAGGSGTRMQATVPKQFLLLKGKPVLMHSIEAFNNSTAKPQIILVMHPGFHDYWRQLCADHNFDIPHQLINGGETRFHSVKNGLDIISHDEALIAVHDAVRPLVSAEIIDNSYEHAATHGNAIVAIQSRDSVRQLKNDKSTCLVRDEIYLVQTPQTFRSAQLKEAYQQPYSTNFNDDASVVEAAGFDIRLIEGSHQNIKITFPEDLAFAEWVLGK